MIYIESGDSIRVIYRDLFRISLKVFTEFGAGELDEPFELVDAFCMDVFKESSVGVWTLIHYNYLG